MGLTLKKLAGKEADVSIQFGEDTVNITYYPARVTESIFSDISKLNNVTDVKGLEDGFEAFNGVLARLIKKWDIYDDDEETVMYPLEDKRLSELPIFLRRSVLDAILGDVRPEALVPPAKLTVVESTLS